MKKKRWLAMLVAVAMICMMLPVTALAEDGDFVVVGGVKVTSENANDVLGDGKVSYDFSTSTLTLNNAVVNGAVFQDKDNSTRGSAIYAGQALTIELVGANTVKAERGDAIDTPNVSVTIKSGSDGSLVVNGSHHGITGGFGVTIQNCTVTTVGAGDCGIYGGAAITGSTVKAQGKDAEHDIYGFAGVPTNSVILTRNVCQVYGDATITKDIDTLDSIALTIGSGNSLTIANGATLTLNNTIETAGGTLTNNGTIIKRCTDDNSYGGTVEVLHTYDQEVVGEGYLKSAATTTSKAVYYKSCICGASSEGTPGEATFEDGDLAKMTLTVQLPDNTSTQVQVYSTQHPSDVMDVLERDGKLSYDTLYCYRLYKGETKLPTETMGGGGGGNVSTLGQLGVVDGDTLAVKVEHTFNYNFPSDHEVSPATCMAKKKVYVECDYCFAYTTEKTVEVGELASHNWVDGVCTYGCGQEHTPHTYKLYTLEKGNFSTDADGKLKAESVLLDYYGHRFDNRATITAVRDTTITIQWECNVTETEGDISGGAGGVGYLEMSVDGNRTNLMNTSETEVVLNLTAGQSVPVEIWGMGYSGTVTLTLSDDEVPAATCTKGRICTVCGHEGERLPHTYDQEVATDAYLKSAADCTNAAVYYKSCSCGASSGGTQDEVTFTSGFATGHSYENGKCTACGTADPNDVSEDKPNTEVPDTGDNSNMMLWGVLLLMAGAGITGVVLYSRKQAAKR